jgi:hypothetical protein
VQQSTQADRSCLMLLAPPGPLTRWYCCWTRQTSTRAHGGANAIQQWSRWWRRTGPSSLAAVVTVIAPRLRLCASPSPVKRQRRARSGCVHCCHQQLAAARRLAACGCSPCSCDCCCPCSYDCCCRWRCIALCSIHCCMLCMMPMWTCCVVLGPAGWQ